MAIELLQAFLAPGQMVNFFVGGMLHFLAYFGQLGSQGLALVQGLGAYLTGVVDAHKARSMTAFSIRQLRFCDLVGRRASAMGGLTWAEGAQSPIRLGDE
ncbi:hypothetical protein R50073_39840 [Maricurvus nonylphenolicus]